MKRSAALFFEKVNNGLLPAEGYSEPCRTSKIELFTKILISLKPWTIFAKSSILDLWQGYEYAFDLKHSDKEYST